MKITDYVKRRAAQSAQQKANADATQRELVQTKADLHESAEALNILLGVSE